MDRVGGGLLFDSSLFSTVGYALFWLLWVVLTAIFFFRLRPRARAGSLICCVALFCLSMGMLLTTCCSRSGTMLLEESARSNFVSSPPSSALYQLPFSVAMTPALHTSGGEEILFFDEGQLCKREKLDGGIYYKGYHFYPLQRQTHFVVVRVRYNPYARILINLGYLLLVVSLVALFVDRQSIFRQRLATLRHHIGKSLSLLLLLLSVVFPLSAKEAPRTLPADCAAQMGKVWVMYNQRLCPLQTVAIDFTYTLCGDTHYRGLTAEQVLSGWLFFFEEWVDEPCIQLQGKSVQRALRTTSDFVSWQQLHALHVVDHGCADYLQKSETARERRQWLRAEERYQLLASLPSGVLLKIFPRQDTLHREQWYAPADPSYPVGDTLARAFEFHYLAYAQMLAQQGRFATLDTLWQQTLRYQQQRSTYLPSSCQKNAECLYNALKPNKSLAIVHLLLGILLLLLAIIFTVKRQRQVRFLSYLLSTLLGIAALYFAVLLFLRGYVISALPMASGYEMMLLLSFTLSLLGVFMGRSLPLLSAGALFLSALCVCIAVNAAQPTISALPSSLTSPWLSLHVSVLIAAYALFAVMMLNGVVALSLGCATRFQSQSVYSDLCLHLQLVSQVILYPAVALLLLGIVTGSLWADSAWGACWSWDPKEVWALITLLIYVILTQADHLPQLNRPCIFHLYCVLAFLSILFTFFGVNVWLGGMHSYL